MTQTTSGRGGKRPGAGRPVGSIIENPKKGRSIRLSDEVWEWLKAQGGAKWIEAAYEADKAK